MTLDIIICTYNRPQKVSELVNDILHNKEDIHELIVVDSSDEVHQELLKKKGVTYIRSERKSQPYQRYLGTLESQADCVCFFDDDVKILDRALFRDIVDAFQDKDIVGVSAGIFYENGVPINQKEFSSNTKKTGEISWLGKATGFPNKNQQVHYFPGPIMAFRSTVLPKLFDEYLFSIFEKRIAMGEDKAISMRASKYGKLYYLGEKDYLYHPPEPSTYYDNNVNFIAKTTFSRLWLNKVYAAVNNQPTWKAYGLFFLYLLKQLVNGLINFELMKGNLLAIKWLIFKPNH